MRVLFLHQNFPGQFKHLAPALVARGHEVHAMRHTSEERASWNGVRLHPYQVSRGSSKELHPWVTDFESAIIRADAVFHKAIALREQGFRPDVIVAHPGWGEPLFVKQVWPEARLGLYCEYYYKLENADTGFDREFGAPGIEAGPRLFVKNVTNFLHQSMGDAAIAPTEWQRSTYPADFRKKVTVVHDGIDTELLKPNENACVTIKTGSGNAVVLKKGDEVLTFVNRTFEPLRGYHIFMRALPRVLKQNPNLRVLLVGGETNYYSAAPKTGGTWKQIFLNEIRPRLSEDDFSRLHFLGNIGYTEFVAMLQVSMVHVYLTYPFVLSWSLLEAMSTKCAIIGSDTAPVQELIDHDVHGCLIDFFDHEALAANISNLISDPAKRGLLGDNARRRIVEKYDLRTRCLPKQVTWVEGLQKAGRRKK